MIYASSGHQELLNQHKEQENSEIPGKIAKSALLIMHISILIQ